jgi:hypothetical protein
MPPHSHYVSEMCLKKHKKQRESKEDGHVADFTTAKALFASTQAPQVPAEAKKREGGGGVGGVGEDQSDSINTDAVYESTQAPVTLYMTTPEFIQFHDPAPSEIPSTNKDDAEEDGCNDESLSTNKDDKAQKDESNNVEIYSRKASGDSLEKASNALTGMSVTVAARYEKRSAVSAASLLTIWEADDEQLSTDTITLTQQNVAAEGYQLRDEEEYLNLDVGLIADILEGISDLPYMLDLGR